ncbi:hypothetical protein Tco_0120877 [Tanacetum coccineum]
MEELCQPSIDGRGGPIDPIPIQAMDFGLHHHMIQQVQNTCQFHGLPGDDANIFIGEELGGGVLVIYRHSKQVLPFLLLKSNFLRTNQLELLRFKERVFLE